MNYSNIANGDAMNVGSGQDYGTSIRSREGGYYASRSCGVFDVLTMRI